MSMARWDMQQECPDCGEWHAEWEGCSAQDFSYYLDEEAAGRKYDKEQADKQRQEERGPE